jgi:hypothetical protein
MLDSATILICPSQLTNEAEGIFRRHVKTYSTGYLLLPSGAVDPAQYCVNCNVSNLCVAEVHSAGDLGQVLYNIDLTQRNAVVVAVENKLDDKQSQYIDNQLDDTLVTPSALYLNGTLTLVNRYTAKATVLV